MSTRLRYTLLLALIALPACDSPTGASGDTVDVRGTWEYEAAQSGSALRVDGTLLVSQQQGSTFSGSLQLREVDASGVTRVRGGLVNGRMLDGRTMDFDVLLDDVARRHVGTLQGDSLSGSWLQPEGNGSINGSFTARRTDAP